jgi:hypothetical protein
VVLMVATFVTVVQVNYWFSVALDHFLVATVQSNYLK